MHTVISILTGVRQHTDVHLLWLQLLSVYGLTVWYLLIRVMVTLLVSVQQKQSMLLTVVRI